MLAALCTMAAGCSESSDESPRISDTGIELNITKAAQSLPAKYDFNAHMNRIYIGERKPEHAPSELHIHSISDLKSPDGHTLSFRLTRLKAQWYKFIVLSVPKIYPEQDTPDPRNFDIFTEEQPGAASCDLNRHLIDYTPILRMAPGSTAPQKETADGDIFRAVLNRWAESGRIVQEQITLKRLNGRLDIDMGILADQFPRKVNSITVEVRTPSQMYLTDDNIDAVKTASPATFAFTTHPDDMTLLPEAQHRHHIISIPLLPGVLHGSITVKADDGDRTYPIATADGEAVIRPNTVTLLRFNGIASGFFDIRYAGYDGTSIDVEEDWNGGWNQ